MRLSWWTVVFIVVLALLEAFCIAGDATAEDRDCRGFPPGFHQRLFQDADGTHRYVVFVPDRDAPTQGWPVLLFLHGAGERGTDGLLPISGHLAVALESWTEAPFIAVFPQCEDVVGQALTRWSTDAPDGQRALKILSEVEEEFMTDPQRRMLVGWSMGGYGAWNLAATDPDLWSAVLVLAGGSVDEMLPLQQLAQAKTPVWAISSRGDPLVPFESSRKLIQRLKQEGGNGTFTLLEGNQHDICSRVFAAPQTFQWLLDPAAIDPATVDFRKVEPLPFRTEYYQRCLSETRVIPDAMALRLGNATFRQLASDLPDLLASRLIEGNLSDIRRTLGQGEEQFRIELSGLHYHCRLTRIWLTAISGGRLGLEVDFEPLELSIDQTVLDSAEHFVRTGPIQIQIGIHEPARLKLEVQPVMDSGKLRLRLLRKQFLFDDGNWYIRPPDQVQARSTQFTEDQMVTGILGSLYESRDEIIRQLLAAVPELIRKAEQELQMRRSPELARMLSPLPVLVPDLQVSPSQVRTDSDGVSVICNFNVRVRRQTSPVAPRHQLMLKDVDRSDDSTISLGFDAFTSVSQLIVEQDLAKVNVLDISAGTFAQLADPKFMQQVLPGLQADQAHSLDTVLRLIAPMQVSHSPGSESQQDLELLLSTPAAALEIWKRSPTGEPVPVGRILFELSQPVLLDGPSDRDAEGAELQVRWDRKCGVKFLRAESLGGSPVPDVDATLFEQAFADAWTRWGQENARQTIPLQIQRIGQSELRLRGWTATDRNLTLEIDALPVSATD